ncbi:MAG TPA: hypothetical protein VKZ49_07190 [Polyangiaceae bacterium]|nr:hypothetical protein [Polyangiaceae bacterium]
MSIGLSLCGALSALSAGCGGHCRCQDAPATPAAHAGGPQAGEAAVPTETVGPEAPPTAADPSAPAEGEVTGSLPEVTVANVGLHVGGGPNDEATKAPFQRAVAQQFEAFLLCYRMVEHPTKGGQLGVDLFISAAGGTPEVREMRTGMSGPQFRACVADAFRQVRFEPPAKGPTVISYSLEFSLKSPGAAF